MEETTSTPFSDTLVVLGGILLGLRISLDVATSQSLVIWWPLGFLLAGVLGRLFLLDSLLSALVNTIESGFVGFFRWLRDHPFTIFRVSLVVVGFSFIFSFPSQISNIPYQLLIGYMIVATTFIIGIIQHEQPTIYARLASVVILFLTLFSGLPRFYSINMVGILILSGSIIFWNMGYQRLRRYVKGLFDVGRRFVSYIVNMFKHLVENIWNNKIRTLRIGLVITGIVLTIYGIFSTSWISYLGVGIIGLAFIDKLVSGITSMVRSVYVFYRDNPLRGIQITSLILSPFAYFGLPVQNNYNIFGAILLVGIGIVPSIYPTLKIVVVALFDFLQDLITDVFRTIVEKPIQIFRIVSFLLIIPVWLFVPSSNTIGNIALNLLGSIFLLIISIGPTFYHIIRSLVPTVLSILEGFGDIIRELFLFLSRLLTNYNTYSWVTAFSGIYGLITISPGQFNLYVLSAVMTAIGISFVGNFYLMRFYDRLTRGITRLGIPIVKFIRFIIPNISVGRVVSFSAWLMLFISIFGFFIPKSIPHRGTVRLFLFFGSIIVWNVAYEKRRKRFVNFINRITLGIVNRLYGVLSWLIRNILLIGLFFLGIIFLLIAIGVIIPGSIDIIVIMLGEILANRLVSWIIGIFLLMMAVYTWQQAFARRVDLQLQLEGGNK